MNIVKPRLHGDHEHRILNTVGTPAEISTDINMEVVVPNYSYSSAMKARGCLYIVIVIIETWKKIRIINM